MFHKKHYYTASLFLSMPDYQGVDVIPVKLDRDFYSEVDCLEFIERNNLHADQDIVTLPLANGVCNPQCFCKIYRRKLSFRRPRRSVKLLFAGFERMRRSVAEEKSGISSPDVPKGYRLAALIEFMRSFK